MNWDLIFTICNNWALIMWLVLAFAPRHYWPNDIVIKMVFYGGVGLLALAYAAIIIPLMTGMISGGASGGADFTSLAGVQALLSSDGGATVGWIHYLAFDLFVGIWIARNADKHGFARWLQVPILFFTLMLGPLGLVLYLLLRMTRHNKVAEAVVPQ
ncbi:MAG: ABA4-like family protein [Parasphingorhabdus sp.]|uniref:ABA4-like family protein n=1 Tax=Parasphingorhabdus sp. TaxID=2709688 RepID=UPI0032984B25